MFLRLVFLALFLAPAARAADPYADLARRVSLEDVVRLAAAQAPAVRAAGHRYDAARHKRPQVVALPDPRLDFMPYLRQMRDDEEKYMFEFTQTLPARSKRRASGRIADKEAAIAHARLEVAVRDAIAEAKEAYFELVYVEGARALAVEVERIYARLAGRAVAGTDADRPQLPESFRAESLRAQLAYEVVQLDSTRAAELERLRAAIGAPDAAVFGAAAGAPMPSGRAPALAELEAMARAHNQELAIAGLEVERAAEEVHLAKLAPVPDVMLTGRYMRTGGEDDPAGDPTRDPIYVGVGVSLPVFGDKYRAQRRQAESLARAVTADADGQRRTVKSGLARAHLALTTSLRLSALYERTLIPQARAAMASAEQLERAGDASLLGVLDTTTTYQAVRLAGLRATADVYQSLARLEKLTGRALALAADEDGE